MNDINFLADVHLDGQEQQEEEEMPPFALLTEPQNDMREIDLSHYVDDTQKHASQHDNNIFTTPSDNGKGCKSSSTNDVTSSKLTKSVTFNDSQNSGPPGLVESMMTDGSSSIQSGSATSTSEVRSVNTSPQHLQTSSRPILRSIVDNRTTGSSSYLMSSLQTVHSDAGVSLFLPPHQLQSSVRSTNQPNSKTISSSFTGSDATPLQSNILQPSSELPTSPSSSAASIGFSQLLQAADDTNSQLGATTTTSIFKGRMTSVPEDREVNDEAVTQTALTTKPTSLTSSISCSQVSGALIVEPNVEETTHNNRRWTTLPSLPTWGGMPRTENRALQAPLLAASTTPVTHLLSNNNSTGQGNTLFERARDTVQAIVEDEQSFQVSMQLQSGITVEDVMRIVGDPELLRLWCNPIETLIVTSSSTEDEAQHTKNGSAGNSNEDSQSASNNARKREYEGEWIEATTTALGSPPCSVGFLYGAGQSILEAIGFTSYGRITMFVERRRGHVGLTVGPFHGGINASHTITISTDSNGQVKIVDRVRLTRDDEHISVSTFFGCFDLCLSRCVLPSIAGYLDQVTTSMARLRLLFENSDISSGNTSIMIVNAPRW